MSSEEQLRSPNGREKNRLQCKIQVGIGIYNNSYTRRHLGMYKWRKERHTIVPA